MSQVTYRKGKPADLEEIKAVTINAYGQFREIISIDNVKAWEENMQNGETYLELFKVATCFVAIINGKIVGSAFLIPNGNPFKWFIAEWSYIRLVAVLPEFGSRGIGRKLTELCIELAKERGEKTIALHTSEFQDAARHIYESMGFKKHHQFELFEKKYWVYTLPLISDNTLEFSYHKAGLNDITTLVEYRIRFAVELSGEQTKEKTEVLKHQMTNYFYKATADKSCISVIAKLKDTVVGIGSLHIREMPGNFKNPSGKWGYIMNMYTVPEFRQKGICSEILNRLIEEGKLCGITAFELHATKKGESVYIKNGFELHNEPILRKFFSI